MGSYSLSLNGNGSGVAAGWEPATWANIRTKIYFRQVPSSTSGLVRIQAKTYFSYSSLSQSEHATLKIYLGTGASGTVLLNTSFDWVRHTGSDTTYNSSWYNLAEVSNGTSVNVYVLCQPSYSVSEESFQVSLSGIKPCYKLSITKDANVASYSYSITDDSKVNGSNRTNQTVASALVYNGDKIAWTATPKSGYTLEKSSGSETISGGNKTIEIKTKAMATVHIRIGGSWSLYSVYVRRSGAWVLHQVNVRKSGAWSQYS